MNVPTYAQLLAENERLREEGRKDYEGMREFQQKYIAADQELRKLRAELDALLAWKEEAERQEPVGVLHVGSWYGEELQDWEFEADQTACDRLNEAHQHKEASLSLYARPVPAPSAQDGWQLMPKEVAEKTKSDWLRANAPGGWVDDLRAERDAMRARIEEMEKDIALKERIIESLGSTLNAVANGRDELRAAVCHEADCVEACKAEIEALRAKIKAMEKQEPVAWLYEAEYSSGGYSDNYFEWRITRNKSDLYGARKIKPLYKTPRAQNTPEKLCYDSRWEIPIDYVDGWNAAVDMMRGKSPSWHCPDCCIAFPFGAPKACPHDDARCNKLLAAAQEAKRARKAAMRAQLEAKP